MYIVGKSLWDRNC